MTPQFRRDEGELPYEAPRGIKLGSARFGSRVLRLGRLRIVARACMKRLRECPRQMPRAKTSSLRSRGADSRYEVKS